MKYVLKITFALFLLLTFFACNEKKIGKPIDLSGMELNLNIDFSKGEFQIDRGIELLAKEMTDYIYSNDLALDDKIKDFSIRKLGEKLLINFPIKKNSSLYQRVLLAPCKTVKKICMSKSCVEKTLKKILGDGSRDVNITYRRNTFSVTIEYTYQDC